jgi:hypothetical protein
MRQVLGRRPTTTLSYFQLEEHHSLMEDTKEEVHRVGHRQFVGGKGEYWDKIGELQFRFLIEQGLSPSDTFVDVGCGSLRGGYRFIRYLDPGRYLGMDKHIELIIYGVCQELGIGDYAQKRPRFVVSETFEFVKFIERPSFGIAQSLFTHLSENDLRLCLKNLRAAALPKCKFFATFFEVDEPLANDAISNSHGFFAYTRSQMDDFGVGAGWEPNYIGEWNHPRNQKIMVYSAV